jgi:hypothetical protein
MFLGKAWSSLKRLSYSDLRNRAACVSIPAFANSLGSKKVKFNQQLAFATCFFPCGYGLAL